MALEITLDVFSGRKNPTWILPTHEFRGITERIEKSNPGQSRQRSKLGYRGMKISTTPDASVSEREFLLELGGSPESLHLSGVPEIEEYLLSMAGDNVDEVIKKHVNSELDAPKPKLGTALFFPACYSVEAPIYDEDVWNVAKVQPFNNCYNYANNRKTNSFAQPGRATNHPLTGMACDGVQPSAQNDGLRAANNFDDPLRGGDGWYVALVIWPGQDFHWYRQDKSGTWSHKAGSTEVTNKDNADNYIADPRACDRGQYTDFCSYMVTGSWVSII